MENENKLEIRTKSGRCIKAPSFNVYHKTDGDEKNPIQYVTNKERVLEYFNKYSTPLIVVSKNGNEMIPKDSIESIKVNY